MKNDTTFVRMRSGDHLGDAEMSKKFHKDSPSGKKVTSISRERLNCRFCVQFCIETLCKRRTSVAHLTNYSFEFFYYPNENAADGPHVFAII